MADLLSHSKRKFIEDWRQKVFQYMENGNICKIVVGEMTPEPQDNNKNNIYTGRTSRKSFDSQLGIAVPRSPPADYPTSNDHLPAVKFGYSHVEDYRDQVEQTNSRNRFLKASSKGRRRNNTEFHDIRSGTMYIDNMQNSISPVELPHVNDSSTYQGNGKRLAKELYDKYNLKSEKNKFPGGTSRTNNGFQVVSMPWRNKTFLTLPLRFNSDQQVSRLTRQPSSISRMKAEIMSRGSNEWEDIDW